jgi:hypothetical protein
MQPITVQLEHGLLAHQDSWPGGSVVLSPATGRCDHDKTLDVRNVVNQIYDDEATQEYLISRQSFR